MTETTPEFNLADILNGVKQTQTDVTLFLDATLADEALSAYNDYLASEAEQGTSARSITDETPHQRFQRVMRELEKHSLKVRLRALSNFEIMSIRSEVTDTYEAMLPRNATETQRSSIQERRDTALFENYLSLSIIGVEYASTGASKNSLSRAEVEQLRTHLPEAEWDKLTNAYLETQTKVAVFESEAKNPTFRGHLAGEQE